MLKSFSITIQTGVLCTCTHNVLVDLLRRITAMAMDLFKHACLAAYGSLSGLYLESLGARTRLT